MEYWSALVISLLLSTYSQAAGPDICEDLAFFNQQEAQLRAISGPDVFMEYKQFVLNQWTFEASQPDNLSFFKDFAWQYGIKFVGLADMDLSAKSQLLMRLETFTRALLTLERAKALDAVGLDSVRFSYFSQHAVVRKVLKLTTEIQLKKIENSATYQNFKSLELKKSKKLVVDRIWEIATPSDSDKINFMISKVDAIKIYIVKCDSTGFAILDKNSESLPALNSKNAFYERGANEIGVCTGHFSKQSLDELELVATIAHEISHSLDPCSLKPDSNETSKFAAFDPVIQCLRSSNSAGARNKTLELFSNMTSVPGCPSCPVPKPNFCYDDQITESFADWLAAEVVAKYIEKYQRFTAEQYRDAYSRVLAGLSFTSPITGFDVHPSAEVRINRILLVNPKIRQQMGCSPIHSQYKYCDPLN